MNQRPLIEKVYYRKLNFFQEEESECEENELISYFGVCSACKLAINHYRNFNFSALDFLSTRSTTCPFCGLRYRDSTEQQVVDDKENESIDEIADADRREQRSSSDPTVPRYRLPPIVSNEKFYDSWTNRQWSRNWSSNEPKISYLGLKFY